VCNHNLNASPKLPLVPSLPQFQSHFRGKDGNMDTFLSQDSLQPSRHISLLGKHRIDLNFSPTLK
jgi:hypothetical protein